MRYIVFYLILFLNIDSEIYGSRYAFTSPSGFSMGGAGFLFHSSNAQIKNPAVYNMNRNFSTSVVKYPAEINSQSIGLNLPLNNYVFSSSLKYISYGVFEGYNEYAEFTGNYKSYETWIDGYLSKKMKNFPIFIGSNLNFKSSKFNNSRIKMLSTSIGFIGYYKNINNAVGLSIHQFGLELKNQNLFYIEPRYVLSGSKKLNYLPAIIYTDFLFENKNKTEFFMGACFSFNKSLKFITGSSTRKIDQNSSQDLVKSILGATGFGFIYDSGQVIVQYGIYYYGVGVSVKGLNIGVSF